MPDTIELSSALGPVIASLDALTTPMEGSVRADRVARLREIQASVHKMVEARRDEFYGAYRATLTANVTPEALESAAETLKEKQLAELELLSPYIEETKEKLRLRFPRDAEVQELVQGTADAAAEFISLYEWLRGVALRLAAEKRTGVRDKLRARPVKGEIDHEALSREFMERFPKIRAALAK